MIQAQYHPLYTQLMDHFACYALVWNSGLAQIQDDLLTASVTSAVSYHLEPESKRKEDHENTRFTKGDEYKAWLNPRDWIKTRRQELGEVQELECCLTMSTKKDHHGDHTFGEIQLHFNTWTEQLQARQDRLDRFIREGFVQEKEEDQVFHFLKKIHATTPQRSTTVQDKINVTKPTNNNMTAAQNKNKILNKRMDRRRRRRN